MKKQTKLILIFLPFFIILFLLIIKENNKSFENEILDLENISIEFCKDINDGSYKENNFYQKFSDDFRKNNNKTYLYQKIEAFKTITGPMSKISRIQVTEQSIILFLENSIRKSTEVFTYNLEGELINLSFFPGEMNKKSALKYDLIPVSLSRDNIIIPAALTLPKNITNPKIAIFVSGLGERDMNDTIGLCGNKPVQDIANSLAEKGIASLRYDKGIMHGMKRDSIEDEYFNDFNEAYNYIMSLDNIDKENIYIIAHDFGATIAPSLAEGKNIKGMILMAGSLKPLEDIIYDKNLNLINASTGLSEKDKEIQRKNLDSIRKNASKISTPSDEKPFNLNASYWQSLRKINTLKSIENFDGKILILQGGNDFEIKPENDFEQYIYCLNNKENLTFHLFENLSHIFTKSDNNNFNMSLYDKRIHVDYEVINTIVNWINN